MWIFRVSWARNKKMAVKMFMNIGVVVLALAGTVPGQAQATTASTMAAGSSSTDGSLDKTYIIGDDDVLGINVWKETELTTSVPVRSDGKISLPLIGEIQASGKTPLELKNAITAKLRTYLSDPDVTVILLQMNSQKFNILGRVLKPGAYSLLATTTVLDAIAGAGGFADFAKQKNIYILRRNPDGGATRIAFNYKDVIRGSHLEENIKLKPNDTIVVP
jgi:polysaccharide biosynthesis/export protein